MRFSAFVAALLPVGAALAQTTHTIKVGENGTLTYSPSSITANNGDTIEFQFLSKNHTVTQSTFASPCSNVTDASGAVTGVDSGYQAVAADASSFPVWSITVNNASTPLWFYCRQGKHCQAGMVFAVNPTQDKTFDAFKTKAATSTAVDGSADASSGAPAAASGSGSAAAGGAAGSTAAAGGASPATGTAAGGASGSTPSPSASTTGAPNGAGMVRAGASAGLLTLVGLSFGLLL
ncbi:Cupredoxin [Trametes maxima]|nr:Cupredoxin [Trametes maxima]